jgi:hypothetical protein
MTERLSIALDNHGQHSQPSYFWVSIYQQRTDGMTGYQLKTSMIDGKQEAVAVTSHTD